VSTIDAMTVAERRVFVKMLAGIALSDALREHHLDDGVRDQQVLVINRDEMTAEGAAEGASTPAAAV
jgi:hypothetical protein